MPGIDQKVSVILGVWGRHTLDRGVVMLLGAGRVDDIHLRKLCIEGWIREHAATTGLVVAENSNGEAYGMLLILEAGSGVCQSSNRWH